MTVLILLYTLQSFFCKIYSDNYPGKKELSSSVFTMVSGFVVTVVSLIFCKLNFSASPITVLLSALCAVSLIVYNSALIKASATGPYSVIMVFIVSGGIIVPAISVMFFGIMPSVVKIICIAVILCSVYFISRKGNETFENKKKFFITSTVLALANGVYSALFDIQQRLTGVEEKEEMVAMTYFFAAVISFALLLSKERSSFPKTMKQTKKSLVFLVLCSFVVAFAINLLATIISTGFDLTLLYTLENACVYLLSVLLSCIVFKEKLTKLNVVGCITLCTALVCVTAFG